MKNYCKGGITSLKRIGTTLLSLLAAAAVLFAFVAPAPAEENGPESTHTIVIYGGGFAGCAAASQAAAHLAPEQDILMIVPETALGSIGTVGGQNFFDIRNWRGAPPTQGSFARWFQAYGQGYPTKLMADMLHRQVTRDGDARVQILFAHEIEKVYLNETGNTITGLTVRPVQRNRKTLEVEWAGESRQIAGQIFIDASDTGRLARLAGVPLSPGRADWAEDGRQQAATLMIQVTGVNPAAAEAYRNPGTNRPEFFYSTDPSGSRLGWGGKEFTEYDAVVSAYNRGDHRFTLKGYNIAEDTPGKWWLNILLIHDVNGMMQELDRGTERELAAELVEEGQWSTDQAYREAIAELGQPRFIQALRRFPGFENVQLVRDEMGRPVVGEVLYLRETAHAVRADGSFALSAVAVREAGDRAGIGRDAGLYPTGVGLGFYYIDINAYRKGETVQTLETPANPHYIPYAALTTPAVDNLLLPGYAQSTSSKAWASMRVIPNLAVCGDAAGMAAAYSALNGKTPGSLTIEDIREIRKLLRAAGARVDKQVVSQPTPSRQGGQAVSQPTPSWQDVVS